MQKWKRFSNLIILKHSFCVWGVVILRDFRQPKNIWKSKPQVHFSSRQIFESQYFFDKKIFEEKKITSSRSNRTVSDFLKFDQNTNFLFHSRIRHSCLFYCAHLFFLQNALETSSYGFDCFGRPIKVDLNELSSPLLFFLNQQCFDRGLIRQGRLSASMICQGKIWNVADVGTKWERMEK